MEKSRHLGLRFVPRPDSAESRIELEMHELRAESVSNKANYLVTVDNIDLSVICSRTDLTRPHRLKLRNISAVTLVDVIISGLEIGYVSYCVRI